MVAVPRASFVPDSSLLNIKSRGFYIYILYTPRKYKIPNRRKWSEPCGSSERIKKVNLLCLISGIKLGLCVAVEKEGLVALGLDVVRLWYSKMSLVVTFVFNYSLLLVIEIMSLMATSNIILNWQQCYFSILNLHKRSFHHPGNIPICLGHPISAGLTYVVISLYGQIWIMLDRMRMRIVDCNLVTVVYIMFVIFFNS